MEYRTLGHSGCAVSSLALGKMTFGSETDEATAWAQLDLWGTNIPIALVGAPDAGRLREDHPGLSLKVARDEAATAMSSPRHPVETADAG